ncbi:MAG: transporter substrate-binding domain-containing protein [Alphaproteobacteria bacterium]
MQKFRLGFLAAALACAVLIPPAHAETALERIRKTNTLHCGYVSYAPALIKDLKTGLWSGFDYDVVKAVSERLLLKAEYAAETGWATVPADLDARKFDMLCSTYWIHPQAAKFMLFSRPVYFQPVFVVARADDPRFDGGAGRYE